MDNLIRVTVPEGGVRTQGSKACTLLCIDELPGRSLSLSLPSLQHQGLFGTHLPSCLLPSLRQSSLSPRVPSLILLQTTHFCYTFLCLESAKLSAVQPCPLLQPAPAIVHGHPQFGLPRFPGHTPASALMLWYTWALPSTEARHPALQPHICLSIVQESLVWGHLRTFVSL